MPAEGVVLPQRVQRIRAGRLKHYLLPSSFLRFRHVGLEAGALREQVALEGIAVAGGDDVSSSRLVDLLNKLLRWPVIPESIAKAPLAALRHGVGSVNRWDVAGHTDALCPFDGPVNLIVAEEISQRPPWQQTDGRNADSLSLLCPRCLGCFAGTTFAVS